MSDLYEVMLWMIYRIAALMMLAAVAAVILAGLALRFVAGFLRGLGDGHQGGDIIRKEGMVEARRRR